MHKPDIAKMRLSGFCLIVIDLLNTETAATGLKNITNVIRSEGGKKGTEHCYTLKFDNIAVLDTIADKIGVLLEPDDSVWLVFEDKGQAVAKVVSGKSDAVEGSIIVGTKV